MCGSTFERDGNWQASAIMLRIVDRYVLKECAFTTLAVIAVLLLILLGNSLVRVLGNIVDGKLPSDALLPMLGINLIQYLVILVPLGLYLGILLGMGRLYKDSEMAALFACGIGLPRLYRPIGWLAVGFSFLTLVLALFLAPWSAVQQEGIKHRAQHRSELAGLMAGQFNESADRKHTLFFESLDARRSLMQKVFLYNSDGAVGTVQVAESAMRMGTVDERPYVVFMNGRMFSGTPGQNDYRVTDFKAHGLRVQQKEPPAVKLRISAASTAKLFNKDSPRHKAELHWRLALPVACLLLALTALPLSHTSPRKGRFAKLGIGILLYIVYSNLLGLGRAWLERGLIPNWLGLWWVHLLLALSLVMLVMYQERSGLFARSNTA
jgi:lipopolysaccharide export system permease protein